MSVLLLLERVETHFSPERALTWLENEWTLSLYVSVLYVVLVFGGRWWMQNKPAYQLRRMLVFWNVCLAVFSALGTFHLCVHVQRMLQMHGLTHTLCETQVGTKTEPRASLWVFLFVVTKVVELGDTAFIILRKKPLLFLHWYHHVTVMIYSWSSLVQLCPYGQWFILLNYAVHTVMYAYYAIGASGYRSPGWVAQGVTVLQLTQFFLGLFFSVRAYYLKRSGVDCQVDNYTFILTMIFYNSYLVLFLHYFYQRYMKKKNS